MTFLFRDVYFINPFISFLFIIFYIIGCKLKKIILLILLIISHVIINSLYLKKILK